MLSSFADTIFRQKYAHEGEEWPDTAARVASEVLGPYFPELVAEMTRYITELKFLPGGRYLRSAGMPIHQVNNCLLMRAEDSREGWATLMHNVTSALMTGAGVGVDYSALRPRGAPVRGMGGESTGPLALMQMVNEAGRHIMQGGSRRSALWAGLNWQHADILDFICAKDWSPEIRAAKEKDFNASAPLDGTNISVQLDDEFFDAMDDLNHPMHDWAYEVYWLTVERMLKTGEPGFSIDTGVNAGETLRNACTEISSRDDSDVCNLGHINLARVSTLDEFERLVEVGTAFLLAGSVYSMLPYDKVADVRAKNRRLGLGLMGVYEWLVTRGKPYAPDEELALWMDRYTESTPISWRYADRLGISRPVKTRALAPTGTTSIIGQTTSSMEPMFAAAYKRRYLKGEVWHWQYVVEPIAARLADMGIDPDSLETAYTLAKDPERRLAMQAWLQSYVDHGISSTLNLPAFEEQAFTVAEFGEILLRYLPDLRGVTCYPDGARGGQPLTVAKYADTRGWEGLEFEEIGNTQACVTGVCGV